MSSFSPYINFNGKGKERLEFYKSVFGGEVNVMFVKDSDMAGDMPVEDADKVFHGQLQSGGITLMGSDMQDPNNPLVVGNDMAIGVDADTEDQLNDWFNKLKDGGKVNAEPQKTEWNAIYADCVDKYGTHWMMNHQLGEDKL